MKVDQVPRLLPSTAHTLTLSVNVGDVTSGSVTRHVPSLHAEGCTVCTVPHRGVPKPQRGSWYGAVPVNGSRQPRAGSSEASWLLHLWCHSQSWFQLSGLAPMTALSSEAS